MEESQHNRRARPKKIISLAKFADDNREALEYDLLTLTGYTYDDIGGALDWGALSSFIGNLPISSATARKLNNMQGFETSLKTNLLLADIFDLLQAINNNLIAIGTHKQAKKITPYPRPSKDKNERTIGGRGALPPDEMRRWIKGRQKHG